ncbi:MAG: FAD-binding oxidoreductase [Pseudomonadota bacterium]
MRIAVVGAGMIGSAAARHLARGGHDTVLIGPGEPPNKMAHRGVFASHYDSGRITRTLDPDPFWARVSAASIARYDEIAEQGERAFFTKSGMLLTGPVRAPVLRETEAVALRSGYEFQLCAPGALAVRFPHFRFDVGTQGLFEKHGAGHIDPRSMVAAQIRAAERAGATRAAAIVTGLDERQNGVSVLTEDGDVPVDQVLVAAGGFSNMVLPEPLPIHVLARTILLAEVTEREAARLDGMPTLIHYMQDGGDLYLLPPIRYPNGRYYLKMGGDPQDIPLETTADIKAWFRHGGDRQVGAMLDGLLRALMPGVKLGLRTVSACVTTYTETGRPALQRVSDRISVATAGCGRGAKCSDELGRLGAEIALGRGLPDWAVEPADG